MNWEYIAGFFDGEGNFQVNPVRSAGKMKSYQLLIRIYSTNKEILERINEFLDYKGHIYTKKASRDNPNRNLVYEFVVAKKENCLLFLQNIFPHLIVKKAQIDYLLTHFIFSRGDKNLSFDLDKFRSFHTRLNTSKFIKNHTITPLTE
jgi:hypothetical protein